MAKPTPLRTATKSLITAQSCVEKILVGSSANGKYAKIGSEVREDIKSVIMELEDIRDAASYLTESISNLIECMSPVSSEELKLRVAALSNKVPDNSPMVFKDLPPIINTAPPTPEGATNGTAACTI